MWKTILIMWIPAALLLLTVWLLYRCCMFPVTIMLSGVDCCIVPVIIMLSGVGSCSAGVGKWKVGIGHERRDCYLKTIPNLFFERNIFEFYCISERI